MAASGLGANAAAERSNGRREELTERPRRARVSLGAAEVDEDDGGRRRPRRRGEVDPKRAVVPERDDEAQSKQTNEAEL
jgi:hypothetical protein